MSSSKPTAADPIRFFLGVLVAILDNVHRLNAAEHPVPESPLWLKYSGDEGVGAGTNKPASLNQPSLRNWKTTNPDPFAFAPLCL